VNPLKAGEEKHASFESKQGKTRVPHERDKRDDRAFSVMKNKFRRGGQTREHEFACVIYFH